jgi:hypothetical protein
MEKEKKILIFFIIFMLLSLSVILIEYSLPAVIYSSSFLYNCTSSHLQHGGSGRLFRQERQKEEGGEEIFQGQHGCLGQKSPGN